MNGTMNQAQAKTVLVTGATGFTGSHLVRALLARGYHVRGLVRDAHSSSTGALQAEGMEPIPGQLSDGRGIRQAAAGCDTIYHIAALYRSAKDDDSAFWSVNLEGTRQIVEAAKRARCRRLVHCSTAGVHGEVQEVPAHEATPCNPGDIYQHTKLAGERLVQRAIEAGVPATVFRPVGIYGPGDTRFLKLFKAIATGRFRMIGSGEVYYHLTHINDLVQGILLCGETDAALGRTYLLAGPRYTKIAELAQEVARAVGTKVPRGRLPVGPVKTAAGVCEAACKTLGIEPPLHRRRLDFFLKSRAFDCSKARRELGFQPRIDLAEGLAQTAGWYMERGDLPTSTTPVPRPTAEVAS